MAAWPREILIYIKRFTKQLITDPTVTAIVYNAYVQVEVIDLGARACALDNNAPMPTVGCMQETFIWWSGHKGQPIINKSAVQVRVDRRGDVGVELIEENVGQECCTCKTSTNANDSQEDLIGEADMLGTDNDAKQHTC